MIKKALNETIISGYPANCLIDNRRIIRMLIILFIALSIIQLAIGIDKTIALVGGVLAIFVVAHTLLKLSAVFRPSSKNVSAPNPKYNPFVSIHIACKNERSETVIKTVEALTKLDYKNYEVIVINNNNTDRDNWTKIRKYVKSCGKNFKFFHLDKMSGFKAGALNFLNDNHMDKKAEIEAIVDSDYIVTPDFLSETVTYFNDPKIGIVQAPQDYYNVNKYNVGLFYEFRSFFAIVMHQAQRLNLVTFTGTMGLIRTDFIKSGLRWNEWCITEDVEAGTHINSLGYRGVYVDKSLGKGLMPYDYASLIKQRQRWAYGNMQIIYKDFSHVAFNKELSFKQKIAFLAQLVTWFHFELLIAVIYLGLQIIHFFGFSNIYINTTDNLLLYLLAFSVLGNLLYFIVGLRKETKLINRVKAFLTHYGLIYVMSSSWLSYFLGLKLGFVVTKKEKSKKGMSFGQYSKEFIITILLIAALLIRFTKGGSMALDLSVTISFAIIEISGIFYLHRALTKTNELDTSL